MTTETGVRTYNDGRTFKPFFLGGVLDTTGYFSILADLSQASSAAVCTDTTFPWA